MNAPLELIHTCQCKDLTSGKTGCFICPANDFHAISPVFGYLYDLYMWMRGKYVSAEYVDNKRIPWRVVPVESTQK